MLPESIRWVQVSQGLAGSCEEEKLQDCVSPAPLQGLGLYAARDIEKHTMVIEYIGTIIRNEVANRKEKLYESQVGSAGMVRMAAHPFPAPLFFQLLLA